MGKIDFPISNPAGALSRLHYTGTARSKGGSNNMEEK